jgi:hypothetical protein
MQTGPLIYVSLSGLARKLDRDPRTVRNALRRASIAPDARDGRGGALFAEARMSEFRSLLTEAR